MNTVGRPLLCQMTDKEMLELAYAFQADVAASFERLYRDDMNIDIQLMMMAATTAAIIERTGESWDSFDHRATEFWGIVRYSYAMIKTIRNQTTETRQ